MAVAMALAVLLMCRDSRATHKKHTRRFYYLQ